MLSDCTKKAIAVMKEDFREIHSAFVAGTP